jgi:hypothetical protein
MSAAIVCDETRAPPGAAAETHQSPAIAINEYFYYTAA